MSHTVLETLVPTRILVDKTVGERIEVVISRLQQIW